MGSLSSQNVIAIRQSAEKQSIPNGIATVFSLAMTKGVKMDSKEKNKQYSNEVEKAVIAAMADPKYWARRRSKWDEWGSPVGLGLWLISLAVVVLLLHIAGLF